MQVGGLKEISNSDFVSGVQYLIENEIISVPPTESASSTSQHIPQWISQNAGWWSEGRISENEFVTVLQWLISNGVMTV